MNKKGFTLTELMAVLLIMIVLVAIALPLYNNAIHNQNNRRAKAYLETINNGLERFHREYPNVVFPSGEITIVNPANTAVCNYNGQQVGSQISGSTFVEQLIVCGYIPRLGYGDFVQNSTTEFSRDNSVDYRFALQNPETAAICGEGFVFMVPKIYSSEPYYNVGKKFCDPVAYGSDIYCRYCAGIDLNGNATDYIYEP